MEKDVIRSAWATGSAGGCMKQRDTFYTNPHFSVRGSGSVTIVLEQIDVTFTGEDITDVKVEDAAPIGLYILDNNCKRCAVRSLPSFREIVDKTPFQYLKYVTLEVKMQTDKFLTVVPCTFDSQTMRQFIISAYSANHIQLDIIE